MTNIELARICAKTQGCGKCKAEIKAECITNACWKEKYVKDRACPAVYYGVLEHADTDPNETERYRRKYFADHGLNYYPCPWPVQP